MKELLNNDKIFIIGFNKTGTRTLHNYFQKNSIPSIHYDNGRLANEIKYNFENNKKLLNGYDKFTVFSDMENILGKDLNYAHIEYFTEMEKQYPSAKFILNIRDVNNWIKSRNKHWVKNQGSYSDVISKRLGLTKMELNEKWKTFFRKEL